mgnify:CR=1 FL=1
MKDKRYGSGQPKADGFFGRIPLPDGRSATEYSVDVDIGGRPLQIPTIVPTLSGGELSSVLRAAGGQEGAGLTEAVIDKAVGHAKARMASGQSPFWRMPEKQTPIPQEGVGEMIDSNLKRDMQRTYIDALRRRP